MKDEQYAGQYFARPIFQQINAVLNLECSFSKIGYRNKAKEPSLAYCLPLDIISVRVLSTGQIDLFKPTKQSLFYKKKTWTC